MKLEVESKKLRERSARATELYNIKYGEKQQGKFALTRAVAAQSSDRKKHTQFIEHLLSNMVSNRLLYKRIDTSYSELEQVDALQKKAMIGAYLFVLNQLPHSSFGVGSALFDVCCETLGIEKVIEVSEEDQFECLNALQEYTKSIEKHQGTKIQWHGMGINVFTKELADQIKRHRVGSTAAPSLK